jgi:hypothetical protein
MAWAAFALQAALLAAVLIRLQAADTMLRRRALHATVIAVVVSLLATTSFAGMKVRQWNDRFVPQREIRLAIHAVRLHSSPGDLVLARHPHIPLYADRKVLRDVGLEFSDLRRIGCDELKKSFEESGVFALTLGEDRPADETLRIMSRCHGIRLERAESSAIWVLHRVVIEGSGPSIGG